MLSMDLTLWKLQCIYLKPVIHWYFQKCGLLDPLAFSLVMPISHASEHKKLVNSLMVNLPLAVFACISFHMKWLRNLNVTIILQAAVFSLCALPCRFHSPNSFAKPPLWSSVCYSSHANRSGPFIFECSLSLPHGPSSVLPSQALVPSPACFICLTWISLLRLQPRQSLQTIRFETPLAATIHRDPGHWPILVTAVHWLTSAKELSCTFSGTYCPHLYFPRLLCLDSQWLQLGLAAAAPSGLAAAGTSSGGCLGYSP